MGDRKTITYTFGGPEALSQYEEMVQKIVREDTGAFVWPATTTLLPKNFPPPVTEETIVKLRELHGVVVEEIQDQD
ncbi:hypothetical protein HIM_08709 [Hirsutella minnesotensis 3608]|uniref:Uncharacterized protein n=1 Tax=Hirsutella minnesotensis 3608 TaxID=1043627 RepID=A0A0F8A3I0_9HYPO|nr:hypothetical protein HIM_08709 [Hirsutella minnesotensis 3608]